MPLSHLELDRQQSKKHCVIPRRLSFWQTPRPSPQQAMENLRMAEYQARFDRLVKLHCQFPYQVQALIDELAEHKSLGFSERFRAARENLSSMNQLLATVYARHRVRRSVINAIEAFEKIRGSNWHHPAVRDRVAQLLRVIERDFSTHRNATRTSLALGRSKFKQTREYNTKGTTMSRHEYGMDDTSLPADSSAASDSQGESLDESLRLMRVAEANGLFDDVVSYAGSLKGTVEKTHYLGDSTLRDAAIKIIERIKTLFQSMDVTAKARTMVDEAGEALVEMGTADCTKAEVRSRTVDVLSAMERSFKATRFS